MFWWTIRDHGDVVGCAMRTAPHDLVLGTLSDDGAHALGVAVARLDPGCPALGGPALAVAAVTQAMGYSVTRVTRNEYLLELDELVAPRVTGTFEKASIADLDLLAGWMIAFGEEVELPPAELDVTAARITEGSLFGWRSDGELVSMAGHAALVAAGGVTVARVGPVYTPGAHRGHGFAAGVTAGVSALLLEQGCRVMLYTDVANATSNGVYERLGYRRVDEFTHCEIRAAR
jgi:predicted GNAT family acetyltransferase